MVQHDRLKYLFGKYLDKTYSLSEKDELFQYINEAQSDEDIKHLIDETWENEFSMHQQDREKADIIFQNILNQGAKSKGKIKRFQLWRYAAAAVIIIALGTASYFLLINHTSKNNITVINSKADIRSPRTAKAMITLSNGQQIVLDSVGNGTLATQGKIKVVKIADGQIAYAGSDNEVRYNTLTNPRGSKVIKLTLSDGTKVWLNNESTLRYPTSFAGNERKVEITGEAYLEVAHNAAMPFKVTKDGVGIQVLGTHFNINSYEDGRDIAVTLLEGSVKINSGSIFRLLKPGQQAQVGKDIKIENDVDLESVMAWKNGLFQFDKASIQSIMRQLERWYDVDVVYEGNMKAKEFAGTVSRRENVSKVLRMLETTGTIHFKIEGRKITVLP